MKESFQISRFNTRLSIIYVHSRCSLASLSCGDSIPAVFSSFSVSIDTEISNESEREGERLREYRYRYFPNIGALFAVHPCSIRSCVRADWFERFESGDDYYLARRSVTGHINNEKKDIARCSYARLHCPHVEAHAYRIPIRRR